jgi:hypothetical protein
MPWWPDAQGLSDSQQQQGLLPLHFAVSLRHPNFNNIQQLYFANKSYNY